MENPTVDATTRIFESQFFSLFGDAVCLAWHSLNQTPCANHDYLVQSFVRSSILNSALSIECAANCCLSALNFHKSTEKDMEWLKTLAKFELFLMNRANAKGFDRNHPLVKPIEDIFALRNRSVHAKVLVREFFPNSPHPKPPYQSYAHLKIRKDFRGWKPDDAKKVVFCVSDFLNYFFFECAGFDDSNIEARTNVANVLSTRIDSTTAPRHKRQFEPYPGIVSQAMHTWDLDPAFLGSFTHTGNNDVIIKPKRLRGEFSS